jgi:hypothetical protein
MSAKLARENLNVTVRKREGREANRSRLLTNDSSLTSEVWKFSTKTLSSSIGESSMWASESLRLVTGKSEGMTNYRWRARSRQRIDTECRIK